MRWNSRFYLKDQEGKERVVKKFLLYPRCFKSQQWRWLEWAFIKERVCKTDCGGSVEWGKYAWDWCEVDFAE